MTTEKPFLSIELDLANHPEPSFLDFSVRAASNHIQAAYGSAAEWSVLAALAMHLSDVRPGMRRLARITGLSKPAITQAIATLEADGAIRVTRTKNDDGSKNTNRYLLADLRQSTIAAAVVTRIRARLAAAAAARPPRKKRKGGKAKKTQDIADTAPVTAPARSTPEEADVGTTPAPVISQQAAPAVTEGKWTPDADLSQVTAPAQPPATSAPPASAKTAKNTKAKATATNRRAHTDAEITALTASRDAMIAWLKYGMDGVTALATGASTANLAPDAMHWHPSNPADPNAIDPDAHPLQLAGFWWSLVTDARAAAGLRIEKPDVGRIIGVITNLKKTMTQVDVQVLMVTLARRWPEIVAAVSWMHPLPTLNEATLANSKLIEVAKALIACQSITATRTAPATHDPMRTRNSFEGRAGLAEELRRFEKTRVINF
ncbi:MAG: hypothetical protein JWN40_3812 [Phycisphaerales bacterium]|nr:hypothetical protein [Phycisphaerales bacterium]